MTQPHYIDREMAEIVSDEEIVRVHANANFGSMPPRQVVNDGVRKVAVGYHCGHTQFTILREHGLITKPRGMSYDCNLTKKGKRYFRVLSRAPAPMEAVAWRETTDDAAFLRLANEIYRQVAPLVEECSEPNPEDYVAAILQALAVIPVQGGEGRETEGPGT